MVFLLLDNNHDTDSATFGFQEYSDYALQIVFGVRTLNDFLNHPYLVKYDTGLLDVNLSLFSLDVDCLVLRVSDFNSIVLPDFSVISLDLSNNDLVYKGFSTPVIVTSDYIILIDYNYLRILKRSSFGQNIVCASVSAPSLNGNGCEFKDGVNVSVSGRTTIYSVARSYMGLVSDNSYTVFYDLVATTGEKLTVPEALLTLHVTID